MLLFRPPLLKFGRAGVRAADIAVGGDEDSPLYNDFTFPDDNEVEFIWALLTPLLDATSNGTTTVDDEGGYAHVDPDDGTWEQDYRLLWMPPTGSPGAEDGTITITVGGGGGTHTASGALVAQAAVVSGAALHPNFSTGALVAGAATVVGTAARLTLHDASGALAAQAATVTGSAAHLTIHTSSGVLVAGAATVSGAALNGIAPPPASPSIGTGAGGGMSNNTHRATILALEAEEAIALRMKQEDEMVLDCITALVAAGVL